MAFEWIVDRYHGTVLGAKADANKAMMAQDVATHAFILKNLGWSREHAAWRAHNNMGWDYQVGTCPLSLDEIEEIVGIVYER